MTTVKLTQDIEVGRQNQKSDPDTYGTAHYPHSNRNTEFPEMKEWLVTRKVMDKRKGNGGHVRLLIQAVTASAAGSVASEWCSVVNWPYLGRQDDPPRLPDGVKVLN